MGRALEIAARALGWVAGLFSVRVLAGLLVAALAFGAVQTARISGFSLWFIEIEGFVAQVDRLADERDKAREAAVESERLRTVEQLQDQESFGAAAGRCSDRLVDAFDAGVAIGEIIHGGAGLGEGVGAHGVDSGAGGGGGGPVAAEQLRRVIGQGGGG